MLANPQFEPFSESLRLGVRAGANHGKITLERLCRRATISIETIKTMTPTTRITTRIVSLAAMALFLCAAAQAQAQTSWASAASGNWNINASWTPAVVPGVGTTATISVSGTYTVTYDSPMSAASIGALNLGSGSSLPTLTILAQRGKA
jgi:hypothetical protein